MDSITIFVDLFALLAIFLGGMMVVAQKRLRSWWTRLSGKPIDRQRIRPKAGEDPVSYAMTIFGMMLLAFGLILFGFFTAFALYTG